MRSLYLATVIVNFWFLAASCQVLAGPEGAAIKGGNGSISSIGNTTTIDQYTDRMAIDWQSYDVGVDERVLYNQPGSSSISLNRILSNRGSEIQGRIDANGHVFLINPNGIIFGQHSSINVGGILASGLDINPDDLGSKGSESLILHAMRSGAPTT